MIKAITFDFWQTLYIDTPELNKERQTMRTKVSHEYLLEHGYSCSCEGVEAGFQAAFRLVADMWAQHRGVPIEACIQRFAETLGLTPAPSDVKQLVRLAGESTLKIPPVLSPHAKEVLPQLRTNYRLGIVSDAGLTPGFILRELMERDGIFCYFTVQTFSDETHHTKPEVVQFHSTLKQLGAEPVDSVHIGDIVRTDIIGAKNAGMKAIRFIGATVTDEPDDLADAVIDDFRQLEETIARL